MHCADVVGTLEQVKATQHKETPMPRFTNSGPAVQKWSDEIGEGSSNTDLCNDCAKHIEINEPFVGAYGQDEPEGIMELTSGFTPNYDEEDYQCTACGRGLTNEDNDNRVIGRVHWSDEQFRDSDK